jgi:hypothetical protein
LPLGACTYWSSNLDLGWPKNNISGPETGLRHAGKLRRPYPHRRNGAGRDNTTVTLPATMDRIRQALARLGRTLARPVLHCVGRSACAWPGKAPAGRASGEIVPVRNMTMGLLIGPPEVLSPLLWGDRVYVCVGFHTNQHPFKFRAARAEGQANGSRGSLRASPRATAAPQSRQRMPNTSERAREIPQ